MSKVAVLIAHLGHYHAARMSAYANAFGPIHVISSTNTGPFKEFSADPTSRKFSHAYLYATSRELRDSISNGNLSRDLTAALDDIQPDVLVVSGWAAPESAIGIRWTRKRVCGCVIMSESQGDDAKRSAVREFVKSRVIRNADSALVGGRQHSCYMVDLGMPEERIFLGYDAVDNDYFAKSADTVKSNEARVRAEIGVTRKFVLASARFIPRKNLIRLISAYAATLRKLQHEYDLVILGDGPERGALQSLISRLELSERVHLPGFKSYSQLPHYYGLCAVFAHVSTVEQWGLVVNEAAASGAPLLISSTCGCSRELVSPGQNGFLVDPSSTEEIADRLGALLALGDSDRRRMGNRSTEIAERWGPDAFARGLGGAVEVAKRDCRAKTLNLADRIILNVLSRIKIETVV